DGREVALAPRRFCARDVGVGLGHRRLDRVGLRRRGHTGDGRILVGRLLGVSLRGIGLRGVSRLLVGIGGDPDARVLILRLGGLLLPRLALLRGLHVIVVIAALARLPALEPLWRAITLGAVGALGAAAGIVSGRSHLAALVEVRTDVERAAIAAAL